MNIGLIPLKYSISEVQKEVTELLKIYPIDDCYNQLSLTHREGAERPFYSGLGSLYDFEAGRFNSFEKEYCHLNKELEGTLLGQVYYDVKKWSSLPIGRVRLMRLAPKSCLSFHVDDNVRYHLPIFSNPQSLFFFQDGPPMKMPANGQMYWFDSMKGHTAMNGDNEQSRIHLVFATAADKRKEYFSFLDQSRGNKNATFGGLFRS